MKGGRSVDQPNDALELEKLGDLLADPRTRKDFFLNAEEAMEEAGIDRGGIPDALVDALQELDYGELGALSRVNRKLLDAGFSGSVMLKWPV
jgi:hypothetical protein